LKADFAVAFGNVDLPDGSRAPPTRRNVWHAEQPYDVIDGGTTLRPVDLPAYAGPHPLVETTVASSTRGAALLRLRTEFVDITDFWMLYARYYLVPIRVPGREKEKFGLLREGSPEYLADHEAGSKLIALGYTAGTPKIWFASLPDTLAASPRPEISCLVFFRPINIEKHTRVDTAHSMNPLNRYLLKPTNDGAAAYWKRDRFAQDENRIVYAYVRAGFEDALVRSAKPVVMVHPWPSGDFGDAITTKLPALADAAIRFLWAGQSVGRNRGGIRLGRLGLSGYSSGGLALWASLAANHDRVKELFCLDASGADADVNARAVVRWFSRNPAERCLRMSGGLQIKANRAIKLAIERLVGPTSRLTVFPDSASTYEPGGSPWWDHVVAPPYQFVRDLTEVADYWHQFALAGGTGAIGRTFLQQFLEESDF
jgi:hypothetical protein